jgi:hypothetical protein
MLIHFVEDRDKWRALVNTKIKFPVRLGAENFLKS